MIKSMTGFGSRYYEDDDLKIEVEIKTLNHRFFEATIKLPSNLARYEVDLHQRIKKALVRGNASVLIKLSVKNDKDVFDFSVVENYLNSIEELGKRYDLDSRVSIKDIFSLPNIFSLGNEITKEQVEVVYKVFDEAVLALDEFRIKEGENLRLDLLNKLDTIYAIVEEIPRAYPAYLSGYKKKLEDNIFQILKDSSYKDERVLAEVAFLADKTCVDEELVRLKSHISQIKEVLNSDTSEVGRKLDFIVQELNREVNTILSKSNDLEVVNLGIELKSLIEKIREQVQNLL